MFLQTIKDLRKLLQRERAKMRQYRYRMTNKINNLKLKYAVVTDITHNPIYAQDRLGKRYNLRMPYT